MITNIGPMCITYTEYDSLRIQTGPNVLPKLEALDEGLNCWRHIDFKYWPINLIYGAWKNKTKTIYNKFIREDGIYTNMFSNVESLNVQGGDACCDDGPGRIGLSPYILFRRFLDVVV